MSDWVTEFDRKFVAAKTNSSHLNYKEQQFLSLKSDTTTWHIDSGLLFWKSAIPKVYYSHYSKPNPKADPKPNSNPNLSTVARICTMDFRNSGPLE